MVEWKDDKQKLVDICFQLVLVATSSESFCKKTNPEKAEWVADQLRGCGFDTKPCGSSWGVLVPKDRIEFWGDDKKVRWWGEDERGNK